MKHEAIRECLRCLDECEKFKVRLVSNSSMVTLQEVYACKIMLQGFKSQEWASK